MTLQRVISGSAAPRDLPADGGASRARRLRAPLLLGAMVGFAGCHPNPVSAVPCHAAGSCGSGQSCLVGACRPAETQVVSPETRRVDLAPTKTAVVCGGRPTRSPESEPEVVTFPVSTCRHATLLLRFDMPSTVEARIAAAFLVVYPLADAPLSVGDVWLEVAPVLERWSPSTLDVQIPATGPTVARTVVNGAPRDGSRARPVRIDVTSLVSSWSRRALDDNGIAVSAASDPGASTSVATGAMPGASGPRLDVYLR